MKVDLSDKTVSAIHELQKNPNYLEWISNAEEYLIDNCTQQKESQTVIDLVQGLIVVRKALKDIVCHEED